MVVSVATGAITLCGGAVISTVLVITVGVVAAVYIMHNDGPSINTNSPTAPMDHHNSEEGMLWWRRVRSSTAIPSTN
ncbi:unnamed protein product [Calypogeia fissa]